MISTNKSRRRGENDERIYHSTVGSGHARRQMEGSGKKEGKGKEGRI